MSYRIAQVTKRTERSRATVELMTVTTDWMADNDLLAP